MKRWLPFTVILAAGVLAVVWAELRKADAPVSPRALLNFIADTQRESTRIPMRLTRLSDAEEISIGDQLAAQYRGMLPRPEPGSSDEETAAYIQRVGQAVAIRARRKLPYRFHYVPDNDFINAFALPGGHIFFGKGLLDRMTTEDQLASVLGHEVEHVDLYHCAERAQVEARLRKIPLGGLVALPILVFQAGYTKAQELEADREGVWLSVRAGFSPYGALRMFEKFEDLRATHVLRARNPQEEISQVAKETLRGYFRSHPLPAERTRQIQDLIAQQDWSDRNTERPLDTPAVPK